MGASGSESGRQKKPPDNVKKKKKGYRLDFSSNVVVSEPTEEARNGPAVGSVDINLETSHASSNAADEVVSHPDVQVERMESLESPSQAPNCSKISMNDSVPMTSNHPVQEVIPKLTEVVKEASATAPEPVKLIMRPPLMTSKPKTVLKEKSTTFVVAPIPPSPAVVPGVSYAQQVSGSSMKIHYPEIYGNYVVPRSAPSDKGGPRPKSDVGLQGLFDGRWQDDRYGMYFEHIRGSAQGTYLEAIAAVIPPENIFSFGMVGKGGMVEVFTSTLESATKLMLEGIEVGGRHLQPYPVSVKPTRVVFSRVPMRADHGDLLNFLKKFGKVHGKVRAIPLKIGDKGLGRGIFSTSREAFISLNQGCTLPSGFYLNIAGSRTFIEVTTEAKCYACHQVGHFVADCPKKAKKTAEKQSHSPAPRVEERETLLVSTKASAFEGQSGKSPEIAPQEAKKSLAEISCTLVREDTTSSDEEATKKSPGKKKRMRQRSKKTHQESSSATERPIVPLSIAAKRPHSEEDSTPRCPKIKAVPPVDSSILLSDGEMMDMDGLTRSGYESCGSALSIGSRFEVANDLRSFPKEKLRSLLGSLYYKKSSDRIWSILEREIGEPQKILPQLKLLQKEAKRAKKYNEAARCERLYDKILEIIEERRMDTSHP